jgi:hypothetical protein
MKFLLVAVFIFLCFTSLAVAKPFVVCDPLPATLDIEGFQLQFDGGAWITVPAVVNPDGTKQIKYDLSPLSLTGTHVVKARAYNMWVEGDESLPFSFVAGKPGGIITLRLSPQ